MVGRENRVCGLRFRGQLRSWTVEEGKGEGWTMVRAGLGGKLFEETERRRGRKSAAFGPIAVEEVETGEGGIVEVVPDVL